MNAKSSFLPVVLATLFLCLSSIEVNAQLFRGKKCRLFSCRQQCLPCQPVQSCTSSSSSHSFSGESRALYSCIAPYPCQFPVSYCKCIDRGGSSNYCYEHYCANKYRNMHSSEIGSGASCQCCPCQTCSREICVAPFPCWHPIQYCRCVKKGNTPEYCEDKYCPRKYGDPCCPPNASTICHPSQSCCPAPSAGKKRCRLFRRCR